MSNHKGFTLIELLVVISIISTLSAVAFGYFRDARDKARVATAQADISEMHKALLRYHIDTDSWPAGFFSNDISSPMEWNAGWSQGYFETTGIDPWGSTYYLDGMPSTECGIGQTAICSAGPNKAFQSFNSPTGQAVGDDICIYFEPEC